MRVLTVKQVLAMEPGEIVPSVRGTIADVYERKTGDNEHGEWSVQPAVLKDDTGSIRIKLWGQPDMRKWKGKEVLLESKSGKQGISGLKIEENEYKGKTTKSLKVSDWVVIDAPQEEDNLDYGDEPKEQPKPKTAPVSAKARLSQAANGLLMAFDAAVYVAGKLTEKHGVSLPPEAIERIAVHLSIWAQKENILEGLMPANKPEQKTKPEPKNEPEPTEPEDFDPEVGF